MAVQPVMATAMMVSGVGLSTLIAFDVVIAGVISAPPMRRVGSGQRVRPDRDAAVDVLRVVDATLSERHGRRHVHDEGQSIAVVAVFPLAIASGDVFGMSGTSWRYMLILTFLIGVAGHRMMVFAVRTTPIGTTDGGHGEIVTG